MTLGLLRTLGVRAWTELEYLRLCVGSGVVGIDAPATLLSAGNALLKYGVLPAALSLSAARYGERNAVIDDLGALSYRELDDRSNRLANQWRVRGLRGGEGVAILARNHRGLLDAVFAAAKCGARIILLNTDFGGPQLRDVALREGVDLLVYDEEYESILGSLSPRRGAYRAWSDTRAASDLESLIAAGSPDAPPTPGTNSTIVLLTSGTTGTPKGAPRPETRSLEPLGAILSRVPFRTREVTECPAPLFHTLGFAMAMLAVGFGSTLVIRRRFEADRVLESMARHHATTLIAVPVMLARLTELDPSAFARKDLSALRIVFVAGSQLGADLCRRATGIFGPVVYNLYGSTEVAYATVATPRDLAAEPGCVGKPVLGAVVKILDDAGREVPRGETGRIFVGNAIQFEGYTGGGGKERVRGLMSSGDVGHFDCAGRLFIDGRDDDMIISGGENVFPGEVEELLNTHDAIREAAVIGVPDDAFGARLKAFVVIDPKAELTEDEVKSHVRASLARYKVPREVVFLTELPRNPTGKVLKRVLQEL
ncbi:acyl-CoA synthetase [Nocardia macrotermitis]|uniref:Long-chain-fatty-acid--CoA ligase n=1 Tax=Nocardia macrotermitis TaxID=2585198 RepID=A0A7K0DBR5_9NOCA|nr:acyl-CoA synthetase [Nocardia macrotermitis]MQY23059.1 Long-chain-fatty-acid--CoA ligase [Nocardia macrotermitis]